MDVTPPKLPSRPLLDMLTAAGLKGGKSQGKKVGASDSTMKLLRTSGVVGFPLAERICKALGVDPVDVYGADWRDPATIPPANLGMANDPQVPVGPLLEALKKAGLSMEQASVRAGLWHDGLRYAAMRGSLSIWAADRYATIVLDVHPVLLWGDDWLTAEDRTVQPLTKPTAAAATERRPSSMFDIPWSVLSKWTLDRRVLCKGGYIPAPGWAAWGPPKTRKVA